MSVDLFAPVYETCRLCPVSVPFMSASYDVELCVDGSTLRRSAGSGTACTLKSAKRALRLQRSGHQLHLTDCGLLDVGRRDQEPGLAIRYWLI